MFTLKHAISLWTVILWIVDIRWMSNLYDRDKQLIPDKDVCSMYALNNSIFFAVFIGQKGHLNFVKWNSLQAVI